MNFAKQAGQFPSTVSGYFFCCVCYASLIQVNNRIELIELALELAFKGLQITTQIKLRIFIGHNFV